MSLLRSLRGVSVVTIFVALLLALLPAAGFASQSLAQKDVMASEMSDCDMCAKTGMAMANCAQAICGLAALESMNLADIAISPARYALVRVAIPLGWHTAPPVSPG